MLLHSFNVGQSPLFLCPTTLDSLARLPEHNLFFCLRKCWRNPVSVMIDFVRIRTWRGLSEHHAAAMDRSRTAIPPRHVDPWAMVTLLALCWANCHQLCPSGCRHGGVHPVLWHKVQIPRVKNVVFVLARDGTIFCSCGPYLSTTSFFPGYLFESELPRFGSSSPWKSLCVRCSRALASVQLFLYV